MRKKPWAKRELKTIRSLVLHKETLRRLEKSELQCVNGGGVIHLPVGVAPDTNPSNCGSC
jgi:hypothetical protein